MEESFGIEQDHSDYSPASAYKTPIYWLLKSSFKETVDFILSFSSKTAKCFAKSDIGKKEVEEIDVYVSDEETIKQFICNRIWCLYRGTQVSPNMLESIHMALEKFLLEMGKSLKPENLESCLFYLLKNSNSASISAVVTSVVLSFPEKTFNIAKILFKTKDFFHFELNRCQLDLRHKGQLLALKRNFSINRSNDFFEQERIDACDAKHRKQK